MATEEPVDRTDLSDLVRTRMDENGQSLRALADACIDPEDPDAGPLWKRGTLDNLIQGRRIKTPTPAQVRALADALRLPRLAVQRAARAQFFSDVSEQWNDDHDTRVLIARIEELDKEDIAAVSEIVDIVLRRRARQSSGQD